LTESVSDMTPQFQDGGHDFISRRYSICPAPM